MDAGNNRVRVKMLASVTVAVSMLVGVLLLAAYISFSAHARWSVILPTGNRFDVAVTRCTSTHPAHAFVFYSDFARENRFIHERIFLLTRVPITLPCP